MIEKLLLSAKEAAQVLSIGTRLLWSLTNAGQIPHVRLGGRVLYSVESLRELIQAKELQGC